MPCVARYTFGNDEKGKNLVQQLNSKMLKMQQRLPIGARDKNSSSSSSSSGLINQNATNANINSNDVTSFMSSIGNFLSQDLSGLKEAGTMDISALVSAPGEGTTPTNSNNATSGNSTGNTGAPPSTTTPSSQEDAILPLDTSVPENGSPTTAFLPLDTSVPENGSGGTAFVPLDTSVPENTLVYNLGGPQHNYKTPEPHAVLTNPNSNMQRVRVINGYSNNGNNTMPSASSSSTTAGKPLWMMMHQNQDNATVLMMQQNNNNSLVPPPVVPQQHDYNPLQRTSSVQDEIAQLQNKIAEQNILLKQLEADQKQQLQHPSQQQPSATSSTATDPATSLLDDISSMLKNAAVLESSNLNSGSADHENDIFTATIQNINSLDFSNLVGHDNSSMQPMLSHGSRTSSGADECYHGNGLAKTNSVGSTTSGNFSGLSGGSFLPTPNLPMPSMIAGFMGSPSASTTSSPLLAGGGSVNWNNGTVMQSAFQNASGHVFPADTQQNSFNPRGFNNNFG